MNTNEQIAELYSQLKPKGDFIKAASKKFGVVPATIRIHWIYGSVPTQHQEEVKEMLEHILKEQKKYAKSIGL